MRAGRAAPGAGLASLVRELEAALIPVNRSAARRALARLARETARGVESGLFASAAVEPAPPAAARALPEPSLEPDDDVETHALPRVERRDLPPPAPPPAASAAVRERAPVLVSQPPPASAPGLSALAPSMLLRAAEPPPRAVPVEPDFEIDIEIELEEGGVTEVQSSVAPIEAGRAHESELDDDAWEVGAPAVRRELPSEQCTRPEPVVARGRERKVGPTLASWPPTPMLGTRVAEAPTRERPPPAPSRAPRLSVELPSAPPAPHTERSASHSAAPPLLPAPKSDVRELLARFRVSEVEHEAELCRALKVMAGVELTPAPRSVLAKCTG